MINLRRAAAVAAAALGLALGALAAPASAATQHASVASPRWQTGAQTTRPEVAAPSGTTANPSTVGICTDSSGFNLGGRFFCGDAYGPGELFYTFPNGVIQLFVIGTDHQVWTRWSNTSETSWTGWSSVLGGSCWGWRQPFGSGYTPGIIVIGSNGHDFAKQRNNNGTWPNNWTEIN